MIETGRDRRFRCEWRKLEERLAGRNDIVCQPVAYNAAGLPVRYQVEYRLRSICGVEHLEQFGERDCSHPPIFANRFLMRVRDFALVKGDGRITRKITETFLDSKDVDDFGLDEDDRRYLGIIINQFGGGPVGVDALAAALSEDVNTLEDVREPYLLRNGFVSRTPKGRQATEKAYRHLGIPFGETE